MRKEKSIYNLSPGWLMHRLTLKTVNKNKDLFNEICVLVSRRLQEKKRIYKNPFPPGDYLVSITIHKTTFDGLIFKDKYKDPAILSGNKKPLVVFSIEVLKGNQVNLVDLQSKSSKFAPITCKEICVLVLNQMGFKVSN
ncbi:MAG: hypothetical protein KBC12_01925 [Candidatus Pacebacteria bacterium]|nr:hypothetical protein [Candidatus Paceibacterota bacterium]MBP9851179.1 hypothetical protein [Candidatus Paceibacterota bacterium]